VGGILGARQARPGRTQAGRRRLIGSNESPARAWLDGYEQLWALLGVTAQAGSFGRLFAQTRQEAPRLLAWMLAHPLRVLDHGPVWPALVATVLWIDALPGAAVYLRQVDVPAWTPSSSNATRASSGCAAVVFGAGAALDLLAGVAQAGPGHCSYKPTSMQPGFVVVDQVRAMGRPAGPVARAAACYLPAIRAPRPPDQWDG